MNERYFTYDYTNVMNVTHGLTTGDFDAAKEHIENAYANARAAAPTWGFRSLPYATEDLTRITELAHRYADECDDFVVVGIGGSALGNSALHSSLNGLYYNLKEREARGGTPRIHVPDNVDPTLLQDLLSVLNPRRTCINVIAKSGSTAETIANFFVLRDFLMQAWGDEWVTRIIITTDPEKGPLRALAQELSIPTLSIPPAVGGRFSVLSPVGLLSAAIEKIEINSLLRGARDMDMRCDTPDWHDNPAFTAAVINYLLDTRKDTRLSVMMPYAQRLRDISEWFCQLWAESLGKRYDRQGNEVWVGPTPIKALGATDQHSQVQLYIEGPRDKFITFMHVEDFGATVAIPPAYDSHDAFAYLGGHTLNDLLHAEEYATKAALTKAGRPHATLSLPAVNAYYIGQLLFFLELQTAYAGELYNINAFDQPGVEQGKIFTYALMGRKGYENARDELESMTLSSPDFIIS